MKKSKISLKMGLVAGLAVVLAVVSIGTPTFSWFDRPKSQTGNSLTYSIGESDNVIVYDGSNVNMETYVSTDDGVTYSTTAADPAKTGTLTPGKRIYYKTVLTNNNATSAQNVSLYIDTLDTGKSGECCVGVNVPIKAYKNYYYNGATIPEVSKTSATGKNTKRIYFQLGENKNSKWTGGKYCVCSSTNDVDINYEQGSKGTYTDFIKIGTGDASSSTFYADIPSDHNKMFIAVQLWGGDDEKRTQTFTNLTGNGLTETQSLLFKLNGYNYGENIGNNTWKDFRGAYAQTCAGANIVNYYRAATVASNANGNTTNNTIDVSLVKDTDYSGSSITYQSSNAGTFTVDANGIITGKAEGTAMLTYTVKSQFGDTVTKTATVTVKAVDGVGQKIIDDAPIVTNLLIPSASDDNVEKNLNVQEIYWFIKNGADSGDLTYTLKKIYLGV